MWISLNTTWITGHATNATWLTDMQNNAWNWLFHNWICQSVCFWCLCWRRHRRRRYRSCALFSAQKLATSKVYIFCTMWFFILCTESLSRIERNEKLCYYAFRLGVRSMFVIVVVVFAMLLLLLVLLVLVALFVFLFLVYRFFYLLLFGLLHSIKM